MVLNCPDMSYCCSYRLASNLHAILCNKIFNKLVNLISVLITQYNVDPVLMPHENRAPGFFSLNTKIFYKKWVKHLSRDYVLRFEALTQVVKC